MQLLVGLFALTQAAHKTCLDQADEMARAGLVLPAIGMAIWTETVFGPVLAAQQNIVDQIAASASSFD